MSARKKTAIIADDHQIVRDGLSKVLGDAVEIVAVAADGLEAVTLAKKHRPDFMTLDIAMPFAQGIAVFTEVKRWSPDTVVAVFSGITSASLLSDLHAAGAEGIFTKRDNVDELVNALPLLLNGGAYISETARPIVAAGERTNELTFRENQILSLVATGKTTKAIAEILGVSPKTVENHRTNIMNKLNVGSMAELLAYALREGLLDGQNQL